QVLRELTELLRPHRDAIAAAWDMCVAFDDLCARARYAVEVNGFPPAIGTGPLEIRNGRHPLLVGSEVVVPFDLVLAPDECTVLVSGPNTGGKTVLIKAVGLLCLMAQSGIIPPIGPQSTLPVFTGVFADIGDRQSIAASLSTFSAHVAALRDILERAGAGSLVLLDEIGSGTDPAAGGALATAVLQPLTRRRGGGGPRCAGPWEPGRGGWKRKSGSWARGKRVGAPTPSSSRRAPLSWPRASGR